MSDVEISVEEMGPPSWDTSAHPAGWTPKNLQARINVRIVVYGPLPLDSELCSVLEFHEVRTLNGLGLRMDELIKKYENWPGPAELIE
jgi:hypothetical protein